MTALNNKVLILGVDGLDPSLTMRFRSRRHYAQF